MNASVSPFVILSAILTDVRKRLGEWGLEQALAWILFGRLGRIMGRMEKLAARFQAGKAMRRAPRTEAAPRAVKAAGGAPRAKVEPIWPRQFGWLIIQVGWRAVGYGGQIRAVLKQPEMVALLKASPQAVRILKPLCRMMMIETSLLYPDVPVPEKAAEVAADKPKRIRKPRSKPDIGRVPIPRGVMSAVRRGRYGKIG